MRRQGPLGDLLRNQRGYRRKKPRYGLALVLAIVGAAALWFFIAGEKDAPGDSPRGIDYGDEMAMIQADPTSPTVEREFVVEELVVEEPREDEALTAKWEEGRGGRIAGELKPNESVFLALQGRNISAGAIHHVVTATGKEFNFRRSRPGDKWEAEVDETGTITRFVYQTSPEDIWITTRGEDGTYSCVKEDIAVETRLETIAGVITSSFWLALEATGESGTLAYNFMDIFSYTIDFNTETRDGDRFAMVFEKIYLDGEFLRYGRVLGATYSGRRSGTRSGFFYEAKDEKGYWEADGESLQRQFLRSPLPFTRITSRFGRRVHPVLGNVRMHQGVDYGAPIGTPVQSVADGVVTFAGWRGSFGKLVTIRHSGGFETYYAHLSVINRDITAGKRISRGHVFGKTGNTGRTTGPHLHFEMKKNGRHVDPLTVDATQGDPLRGKELEGFKAKIAPLMASLEEALSVHAPPTEIAVIDDEDDED